MLCATLRHVWANRIYQHLLLEPTVYLSGICQMHISGGFPNPLIDHMPILCQVLKGIKVQTAKLGKPIHTPLPITPSIHWKLKSIWLSGNPSYDDLIL